MRLRLTVRRHGLPETPIIWTVENEAVSISQLLMEVNEAIPIQADGNNWGFEDYAVELKGNSGVNYECLHYQIVGKVFKEDDEVIIRPLLTQDIKIRRVSGRNQISADGKRLLDGLVFGRPLLRRPADRPPVNIPPLKRRRIDYDEPIEDDDDDDDEGFEPFKEIEEGIKEENTERQLTIHADFDDDSEDDEEFEPGEDDEPEGSLKEGGAESEEDDSESKESEQSSEEAEDEDEPAPESQNEESTPDDIDESLRDVPKKRRSAIRKLHSAFPRSTIAICKYVLEGTDPPGNVDEAYDAMAIGFRPASHKGTITESSQENLKVRKTRSKAQKPVQDEPEDQDSMQVEMDDSINAMVNHYDQHGLPAGSISSGRALSVMAEVMQSSPSRPRPSSRGSVASGKSVKSSEDGAFANGLTSTPFIDRESQLQGGEEIEVSSDSSSSDSSSEEESEIAEVSEDTSSSESDSSSDDSSSEASSDSDEAPEETSSKPSSTVSATPGKYQHPSPKNAVTKQQQNEGVAYKGKPSTISRNHRRRLANTLERYKKKGILPAGTTTSELMVLRGVVDDDTPQEVAHAALEEVRSGKISVQVKELTGRALSKATEFEAKRKELLDSLQAGGIDVSQEFFNGASKSSPIAPENLGDIAMSSAVPTPSKQASVSPSKSLQAPVASATPSKKSRTPAQTPKQNASATALAKSPSKALEVPDIPVTPARASKSPSKAASASATLSRASRSPSKAPSISATPSKQLSPSRSAVREILETQADASTESHISVGLSEPIANIFSTAPQSPQPASSKKDLQIESGEMSETLRASSTGKEVAPQASPKSITPTASVGSARSGGTPGRRAKLDLSASRRLLFSGLGVRTPKTKQDEDKLRENMMKDVRPLLNPRVTEDVPKAVEETGEEEDPQAWRAKLNYRAVECCYDGVVLSEPPFPFVQRWDPQQQGGWSQRGKRGGKRKQDMRDQSQFYETQRSPKKQKQRKGKHNYAEEQEYLDASYEPSYQEESYQEESIELSYDEPTQDSRVASDTEGDVNQQLMNDLNENASAATSQPTPEDLAPLPKDLSTLPDLEDGQAKAGMTIAFRQLDMGAHTGWSPLISAWRTAIVISAFEDEDLHLSLALRDRKQRPEQLFDEETGKKLYGKFEMPTEDEMEDDGTLYISYKQLRSAAIPKIVQEAPADLIAETTVDEASRGNEETSADDSVTLSHEAEEPAEAQLSHVTETPLHSDAPDLPESQDNESAPPSHQPEELGLHQPSSEEHIAAKTPGLEHAPSSAAQVEEPLDVEEAVSSTPHAEVDDQMKEDSPPQIENALAPEKSTFDKVTEPEQSASQPESKTKNDASNDVDEHESSNVVPSGQLTVECPICNASLDGVTPDLATRHVNGCLDGNLVPLPSLTDEQTTPIATTADEVNAVSVSEEARQDYSRLIKDAGFDSSIIALEDIRPEGVQSPGDAAVFERLMNEMAEPNNDTPYSPRYRGLDASRTPEPRQNLDSPTEAQVQSSSPAEPQSSWQTIDSQLPSSPPAKTRPQPSSPVGNDSWQTVDSQIPSSSPTRQEHEVLPQVEETPHTKEAVQEEAKQEGEEEQEEGGIWQTVESPESPKSPPMKVVNKKRPSEVRKSMGSNSNINKAEELLDILHAPAPSQSRKRASSILSTKRDTSRRLQSTPSKRQSRETSIASNIELQNQSPAPVSQKKSRNAKSPSASMKTSSDLPALDGADERIINPTVQYPKLSVGSSFTSQISDHGRQPDVNFEDTIEVQIGDPKDVDFDDDPFNPDDAMIETQSSLPAPEASKVDVSMKQPENSISDDEPEPRPRMSPTKSPRGKKSKKAQRKPVSDDEDSSDSFLSVGKLSQETERERSERSRSRQIKREKSAPIVYKDTKHAKPYRRTMDAVDEAVLGEDQTTPKASQKTRNSLFTRPSASQPLPLSWNRRSDSQGFQPEASVEPRGSQKPTPPPIFDLTQTSSPEVSDAEPEVTTKAPGEEDLYDGFTRKPRKFEEDYEYEEPGNKRASSQMERRRHTSVSAGLRASSQASINTKTSRRNTRS